MLACLSVYKQSFYYWCLPLWCTSSSATLLPTSPSSSPPSHVRTYTHVQQTYLYCQNQQLLHSDNLSLRLPQCSVDRAKGPRPQLLIELDVINRYFVERHVRGQGLHRREGVGARTTQKGRGRGKDYTGGKGEGQGLHGCWVCGSSLPDKTRTEGQVVALFIHSLTAIYRSSEKKTNHDVTS